MVQYLREHEVKDEQIMLEDQSRTTRENLRFSKAYLEELKTPVGIVTNNFHLFRALLIGRSEGYENLTGIAAGCNRILFLNYMVREFFAVVWLWIQRGKRNHVWESFCRIFRDPVNKKTEGFSSILLTIIPFYNTM